MSAGKRKNEKKDDKLKLRRCNYCNKLFRPVSLYSVICKNCKKLPEFTSGLFTRGHDD